MFTLYRRGPVFWYSHSEFGAKERHSLQTRDPQVAKQLLRQIEIDVLSGGKLKRIWWAEFEAEFIRWIEPQVRPGTLKGYRHTCARFGKYMSRHQAPIAEITPATISAFTAERVKDVHPSTKRAMTGGGIKFDLRILHRAFRYAVDSGYIAANPVRAMNLNSDAGRTMPFTQEEIDAMLTDPVLLKHPRLRAIVLTFLHTGLRINDVRMLAKSAIRDGRLLRQTQKRGTVVSMRLHPKLLKALETHLKAQNAKQRASGLVFSTDTGAADYNLYRMLRDLWKRCGVAGGHPHRFRDTYSVRLLSHGASLYDVAKLLGISAQTVERHYSPYVRELVQRGEELVQMLDFVAAD